VILLRVLALAFGLAAGPHRADALATLEQNPSSAATEQVARIYRGTKDPYARLWLVDALYARVREHQDARALEVLWEASRDKHPDVRRKAVAGLEAFRYLPETRVRELWLAKVESAAQRASRDPSSAVRSAGVELGAATRRWRDEKAAAPPPPREGGEFSRALAGAMPQVFVWVVSLQLVGFAWHKLGVALLGRLASGGEAVIAAIGAFDRRPALLLYPAATSVLLLPTLGLTLAWLLIVAGMPSSEAESVFGAWRALRIFCVVYLSSGLACFLPAELLAGALAGGFRRAARRFLGFALLGLICLVWVWPAEALERLWTARSGGPLSWTARTGAPLAALLAARLMIEGSLPAWEALRAAAERFPDAAAEPGSEYWGRPLGQPAFLLWCLASPVLFFASLAPAMLVGFKPTQLFGLWFVTNVQFAVGFGWWAGALLSVSALGQMMILGAIKGGE
jgi:hypothetical protein